MFNSKRIRREKKKNTTINKYVFMPNKHCATFLGAGEARYNWLLQLATLSLGRDELTCPKPHRKVIKVLETLGS
jgi:hypothetical protein